MEKEFIPYAEALALKELGFDEPCFSYYLDGKLNIFHNTSVNDRINSKTKDIFNSDVIVAPLYQQAFKWFRENYNLHSEPYTIDMGAIEYCFQIRDLYSEKYVYDNFVGAGGSYHGTFFTPEEAELECLKKLIEIVKEK
jgi:hypothetical protein